MIERICDEEGQKNNTASSARSNRMGRMGAICGGIPSIKSPVERNAFKTDVFSLKWSDSA